MKKLLHKNKIVIHETRMRFQKTKPKKKLSLLTSVLNKDRQQTIPLVLSTSLILTQRNRSRMTEDKKELIDSQPEAPNWFAANLILPFLPWKWRKPYWKFLFIKLYHIFSLNRNHQHFCGCCGRFYNWVVRLSEATIQSLEFCGDWVDFPTIKT